MKKLILSAVILLTVLGAAGAESLYQVTYGHVSQDRLHNTGLKVGYFNVHEQDQESFVLFKRVFDNTQTAGASNGSPVHVETVTYNEMMSFLYKKNIKNKDYLNKYFIRALRDSGYATIISNSGTSYFVVMAEKIEVK